MGYTRSKFLVSYIGQSVFPCCLRRKLCHETVFMLERNTQSASFGLNVGLQVAVSSSIALCRRCLKECHRDRYDFPLGRHIDMMSKIIPAEIADAQMGITEPKNLRYIVSLK